MIELLLIRHGETDWNAERRLQGHIDIGLNTEGRRQAAALGHALREEAIHAVIASDLQRAVQTAQAIAAPRGMQVRIEPALRERCYGAFEGLRYDEIGTHYPEAHAGWLARDPDMRYPDGVHRAETLHEFFARATGAIERCARQAGHGKIALVTHGGVLDCAYRAAAGLGLSVARDFPILNASINRVVWDGVAMRLGIWSDVAHLSDTFHTALDELA